MKLDSSAVGATLLAIAGAMGCSSAKAPPADGAMSMRIYADTADPLKAKNCKIVHNIVIAKEGVPPDHGTANPGGRFEDQSGGYGVACKVHGSTDFSVSGSLNGAAAFSFSASKLTKGGTGEGSITEYDSQFQTTIANDSAQPCTFTVTPDPLQVASGRIWATFSCPLVLDSSQATTTSCVASGEFVFENCSE